jgi:hypothetical protein
VFQSREDIAALAALHGEPNWERVLAVLKAEREDSVRQMVGADKLRDTEFYRGKMAGRAAFIDALVELAENAPNAVREFGQH